MERREMIEKMVKNGNCIGVRIFDVESGNINYAYYSYSKKKTEAMATAKRLHEGNVLRFYSLAWARKLAYKEYREVYKSMYWAALENDFLDEDEKCDLFEYKDTLIRLLMKWTGCSRFLACIQVETGHLFFKFKEV